MTKATHTPGPWFGASEPMGHVIIQSPHRRLSICAVNKWADTYEQDKANARLIAEAPAMLAALREALAVHGNEYSWGSNARAILSRIDGGAA